MWIEIVGWIGMVLLLGAFTLASLQKIRGDRYIYHAVNLLGAIGVGVNAYYKGVMPQVAVEVVWSGIAVLGLVTVCRGQRELH